MTEVLGNIIMFGMIVLLFYFMNLSEKNRLTSTSSSSMVWAILPYSIVILGYLLIIILGNFFTFILPQVNNDHAFPISIPAENWPAIGLSLIIPSLAALILLIPIVRKGLAKLIPIDANNRVHALALAISMLVFIQLFVTTAIGLDFMAETTEQSSLGTLLASLWSQDIMLAFLSLIGVGFLTRRNLKETLSRLGFVKPRLSQLLIGILIGFLLIILALTLESISSLFQLGQDPAVDELTEDMLGPLFTSFIGILTLGLAAALGEETLFRGALQPRFGLIFTTILFTFTHANYGFSIATLVVFVVGLCLGFVRMRLNTNTAMVIHATYNIGLGLLTYLSFG
ncbi:CPBP family intramembrane metalloprotease [Hazenella sp. IB182357]|uniref:CPBP family intramembrane metalloprotease n=1 Tax=Polycladospora coralii TaxID=2771432 RepID=A0A926N952_9BACL|nr:CPBP family intramembrane glutamic endopeptidase [Polycladospora coralii]MBD1372112.1 CPBP family intramembrane metalloprotease [Polycladospora coralii]MBS7530618.1 CPBP family intramembrane metalloprotease [Polycladospora coralii]